MSYHKLIYEIYQKNIKIFQKEIEGIINEILKKENLSQINFKEEI